MLDNSKISDLSTQLLTGKKILYSCVLLTWLLIIFSLTSWAQLIAFSVAPCFIIWSMKSDVSHPLVIYSFFFLFYSISFPVLGLASIKLVDEDVLQKVVICEALGFTAFSFGVFLCSSKIPQRVLFNYKNHSLHYKLKPYRVPLLLLLIVFLLSLFPLFKITSLGLINKQEITKSGEFFLRTYSIFYPLILYIVAFVICQFEQGKERYSYIVMAISIVYFIVVLGITGERDVLFYLVLMLLIYLSDIRKKFSGGLVLGILLAGVILLPVSHMLKGYIIAEDKSNFDTILDNGFIGLLQGDFASAGNNLYNIIYYTNEYHNGERFINDIYRVFSSNLFGINEGAISSTKWYHMYFLNTNGAGRGFSIVAEGYLDFGYIGIILLMGMIGFFLQVLYRYRYLNSLMYVYYIFTLITACYCIRADMANFISNSIKFGLIPLLFISFCKLVFARGKYAKNT